MLVTDGPVWGDREATRRDHAATSDLYKTLVDVRFKLLTFVPAVTAIAVGIVAKDHGSVSAGAPLLGDTRPTESAS